MSEISTRKAKFYEEIIESTRRAMLDFARAHMKDASHAEDVVQDACFAAWKKIDILMLSPNPGGWLMNALKNCMRRHYEKAAAERTIAEALMREGTDEVAYPNDIDEDSVIRMLSLDDLRIAELREQGYGDKSIHMDEFMQLSAAELADKSLAELRALLADEHLLMSDGDASNDLIFRIAAAIRAKENKTDTQLEAERVRFWAGMVARYDDKIPVRLEDVVQNRKTLPAGSGGSTGRMHRRRFLSRNSDEEMKAIIDSIYTED
jgi:DNA-directed RNA polymerase specialized sigma24 family protein